MRLLILFALLVNPFFTIHLLGQSTLLSTKGDSLLMSSKDSLFLVEPEDSLAKTGKSEIVPSLEELIKKGKAYTLLSNEIRVELEKKLDTAFLYTELTGIEAVLTSLESRTKNPETKFNFRYVNALDRILEKTQKANDDLDKTVQEKLDNLNSQDSLLSIIRNDELFRFRIRDTLLLPNYTAEIDRLKKSIHVLDSALFKELLFAARFQSQLSINTIRIRDLGLYVEKSQEILENSLLSKEINYLWEDYSVPSPKSIIKITLDSLKINFLLLNRQLNGQGLSVFVSLLLIFSFYVLVLRILKNIKLTDENSGLILSRMRFLTKSPIAGIVVSLVPILFFLFEQGSINFITLAIFIQVFFSTILIFRSFGNLIRIKWLILLVIFIIFSLSNLYWEIAYQERMYLLFGDILAILVLVRFGSNRFTSVDKSEEKFVNLIRIVSGTFLILGILANLFGRFSLAKILSVAGIVSFMHAISLYFFLKVTMEIVYVLVENNKKHDAFDALLNFNEIQKRMKSLLVVIGVVFWLMILLHNLALNNYFFDTLSQILSKERMLGNTPYSFGAILLFAGLIYGSSILANNVAYFFSIKDQKSGDTRSKKLGSSVLIIRLGVLTLGFFIAATAAKIPLDKITIVLGALSVGIGFGLQTIINNLVSGLILAFERPIQIGDDIEVGTMSGKVKEVGIRASKILAYDGSEIIVPNGDLLSQSLINWTLSDQRRRVELIIGVAYKSDMAIVKKLMEEVLNQGRILKYPAPKILMQNFGESSVDFRLLFWVESMDIYIDVRNEVMQAIFETFHVNGIEIPFPKRDLYLKELPEDLARPTKQKKSPES